MSNERFASVWDAIEDTPAEAEDMKLRSKLMRRIVLPADPADPEDFDVTAEAMDRAQKVRTLRRALGLSTSECMALLGDPDKIGRAHV